MISDEGIAKSVNLTPENGTYGTYGLVAERITKECKLNFKVDRTMVKKLLHVSLFSAA